MRNQIIRNVRLIYKESSNIINKESSNKNGFLPITFEKCLQIRNFSTTSLLLKKTQVAPQPVAALLKKKGPMLEKTKLPVETDPYKLANFVCGSDISKENPQDVQIKDDSEYPDWLWEVRLGKAPPLHEMDPNTKQYWRRTFDYFKRYRKDLKKIRKF